mmetsp:Transcript_45053/g.119814  ORF Transcript_45053/g.119814 Transcript_45053/m.119814 type:complete len:173 (-) Transcript_45053:196-714(-)
MVLPWSLRVGIPLVCLVLVCVDAASKEKPISHVRESQRAVHHEIAGEKSTSTRSAISEDKKAELKKHAVSSASLINTKMSSDDIPLSPLEGMLGTGGDTAGDFNKTTGKQITGIDPVTGKRIDTGDMPSFIFPILLALGGTVIMVAVFAYMCCFKTEAGTPEPKRAPAAPKK